jgi:hypothetical protein
MFHFYFSSGAFANWWANREEGFGWTCSYINLAFSGNLRATILHDKAFFKCILTGFHKFLFV